MNNESGTSLIEVSIAVAILLVVMAGLMGMDRRIKTFGISGD